MTGKCQRTQSTLLGHGGGLNSAHCRPHTGTAQRAPSTWPAAHLQEESHLRPSLGLHREGVVQREYRAHTPTPTVSGTLRPGTLPTNGSSAAW